MFVIHGWVTDWELEAFQDASFVINDWVGDWEFERLPIYTGMFNHGFGDNGTISWANLCRRSEITTILKHIYTALFETKP